MTSSRISERSPRIYRLRHQVCTPPSRINPGMMNTVSQKIRSCWSAVSVIRRSWGSRGRIADQVLLLREPVHRVHEQVAVALNAQPGVRREVGVAEHDDACFGLVGVFWFGACRRRAARRSPVMKPPLPARLGPALSPLSSSRADLARGVEGLDVGLGPAVGAGLDQRLRELPGRRRQVPPAQPTWRADRRSAG